MGRSARWVVASWGVGLAVSTGEGGDDRLEREGAVA